MEGQEPQTPQQNQQPINPEPIVPNQPMPGSQPSQSNPLPPVTGITPPATSPVVSTQPIRTHLGMAIASIFFFWPLSIPAIISANKAKNLSTAGNLEDAQSASKRAKTLSIICFILGTLGIALILAVLGLGAVALRGEGVVAGSWEQTGAGLTFDQSPGDSPDYVVFDDKKVTWYYDKNNRSNNFMSGTYEVQRGNKTNDKGELSRGDFLLYTLYVTPDSLIGKSGKSENLKEGLRLEYLVAFNPNQKNEIRLINSSTFNGYKFTK